MKSEAAPRIRRIEDRGRQDEGNRQPSTEHKGPDRDARQQQRSRGETKTIELPGRLEVREGGDTDLLKETRRVSRKDKRLGQRCQRHGAHEGATAASGSADAARHRLEPPTVKSDAGLLVELVRLAATVVVGQLGVDAIHRLDTDSGPGHTATTDMGRTMEAATDDLITGKVRMRSAVDEYVPLSRLNERLDIEPGTLVPDQRFEEKRQTSPAGSSPLDIDRTAATPLEAAVELAQERAPRRRVGGTLDVIGTRKSWLETGPEGRIEEALWNGKQRTSNRNGTHRTETLSHRLAACGESRGSGLAPARSSPYTERPWQWARDRRRARRRRCGWTRRTFRRATGILTSSG